MKYFNENFEMREQDDDSGHEFIIKVRTDHPYPAWRMWEKANAALDNNPKFSKVVRVLKAHEHPGGVKPDRPCIDWEQYNYKHRV
jgi:hypothetical protein